MNYKYLIIVIILLATGCAQQTERPRFPVDPNSIAIDQWVNMSRDSTHLDLNTLKSYLLKAQEEAMAVQNDTVKLDHLSRISLAHKRLGDSLGFRGMNQKVIELSQKSKLNKALGESHWDMASFLKSYGVMDSAFYHYQKANESFLLLPIDSTSLSLRGRILYGMGDIQNYFMDYLGAEKSVTEALRIFNGLEDNLRVYNCNNLLGIISNDIKNYDKALENHKKAGENLKKLRKVYRDRLKGQNQNNIAFAFLGSKDYRKAEVAYRELLKDNNLKANNPELYSTGLVSLGYALFKGKGDYQIAKSLLDEAIAVNDSVGFAIDQVRAKQYYAELFASEGDTINATQSAKESLALAKQTSNNEHHLEVLRILTTLDSENAVAYSNQYYVLSEKIKTEERVTRDKFARIRLETDEVIQQNQALTRDKMIWSLIAIGLFLAGTAVYVILAQRASNNKLKYEQRQQETNQEIYDLMLSQRGKFEEGKQLEKKRISEELHDGVLGEMLGIRLMLSGLNESDDETSVEQRAGYLEKLKEVAEEIRTISHELSHDSYQKFYNFIVSLEELVETVNQSTEVQCSFTYDETVDWDDLVGEIKINAYRIVQESLKNCVKHAKASKAEVSFTIEEEMLKLAIADDGVGFDTTKKRKGIGFRNLLSRVNKMGGTLDIESKKGKGTTITVELPPKYIVRSRLKNVSDTKEMVKV